MPHKDYHFKPIGVIQTPFKELEGMPIQPRSSHRAPGKVILDPEFAPGLKDLEGFSHLILVYIFHLAEGYQLQVEPFLDNVERGLFATRAPRRPNPIGISVVRLRSIKNNHLEVEDVDVLDGTPLLDIKPYIPDFDPPGAVRVGWLEGQRGQIPGKLSDDRFS
jgi:tRNA-Thr(GGU) m(6)t(6)A37 methyltransferase TsaA